MDSSLQSWTERCVDLEAGVQDLIRSLERYGTSLDSDPERLAVLQDRLSLLKRLERRHGQDLAGLIQQRDALRERQEAGGSEDLLRRLQEQELAARADRDQHNALLTRCRESAAQQLQTDLMATLRPMGLANMCVLK